MYRPVYLLCLVVHWWFLSAISGAPLGPLPRPESRAARSEPDPDRRQDRAQIRLHARPSFHTRNSSHKIKVPSSTGDVTTVYRRTIHTPSSAPTPPGIVANPSRL